MTTWIASTPETGGTVGGDGAGEATSVRYTRPDVPGAMITVSYYTVDRVERGGQDEADDSPRWDVESQTEFLICTDPEDPGMSEVWSDYVYDSDHYAVSFPTEAEAEEKRDAALRRESPDFYSWDGVTTR